MILRMIIIHIKSNSNPNFCVKNVSIFVTQFFITFVKLLHHFTCVNKNIEVKMNETQILMLKRILPLVLKYFNTNEIIVTQFVSQKVVTQMSLHISFHKKSLHI
jgi:hypothetical protein